MFCQCTPPEFPAPDRKLVAWSIENPTGRGWGCLPRIMAQKLGGYGLREKRGWLRASSQLVFERAWHSSSGFFAMGQESGERALAGISRHKRVNSFARLLTVRSTQFFHVCVLHYSSSASARAYFFSTRGAELPCRHCASDTDKECPLALLRRQICALPPSNSDMFFPQDRRNSLGARSPRGQQHGRRLSRPQAKRAIARHCCKIHHSRSSASRHDILPPSTGKTHAVASAACGGIFPVARITAKTDRRCFRSSMPLRMQTGRIPPPQQSPAPPQK